jgi:transcriptional regulator with XRE-family HTH domain
LSEYVSLRGLTHEDVARGLGLIGVKVTRSGVTRWVLSNRSPGLAALQGIARWSGGAVDLRDWLPPPPRRDGKRRRRRARVARVG